MTEKTYKIISGIMVLLLMLGGTTYYIQDTGNKGRCITGWDLQESGEFQGQYKCQTNSSTRYQTCFDVYNSVNTENYWCKKGVLVKSEIVNSSKIVKPKIITQSPILQGRIHCTNQGCN